jgi:hypothetical protein
LLLLMMVGWWSVLQLFYMPHACSFVSEDRACLQCQMRLLLAP